MKRRGLGSVLAWVAAVFLVLAATLFAFRERIGRALVLMYTPDYRAQQRRGAFDQPLYDGKDANRPRIGIRLQSVSTGLNQPTDIQFQPGNPEYAVVLEREGKARWLSLKDGTHGVLFEVKVATASEEGLLGLAFHPDHAHNRQFFINYVCETPDGDFSRIERWELTGAEELRGAKARRIELIMEVRQPYPNHNAGQLAFGPDGYLYIGWGDGGLKGDPRGRAQDRSEWLGSMLRVDVNRKGPNRNYAVPADNPFVNTPGVLPETFAFGLRNPWRYTFDPLGRLIVADVGQDSFEEIDIVAAGTNQGWALKEGFDCYPPGRKCGETRELVDPIYTYGREEGVSVTGGYVYNGTAIPELVGRYVFGDFALGRVWALELPGSGSPDQRAKQVFTLGRWPILLSSFGRDQMGELYALDFGEGTLYRLAPAPLVQTADQTSSKDAAVARP